MTYFMCHVFWLQFIKWPDGVPKVFIVHLIQYIHSKYTFLVYASACALLFCVFRLVWCEWMEVFTHSSD